MQRKMSLRSPNDITTSEIVTNEVEIAEIVDISKSVVYFIFNEIAVRKMYAAFGTLDQK